mgnify:FL=1
MNVSFPPALAAPSSALQFAHLAAFATACQLEM